MPKVVFKDLLHIPNAILKSSASILFFIRVISLNAGKMVTVSCKCSGNDKELENNLLMICTGTRG